MRVLFWHVHGGYTDAFVRGDHEYLLPVNDVRDASGLGLDGWPWSRVREVAFASLRDEDIDVVVLQRPEELELVQRLTGRRAGRDIPALYLEHNAPRPDPVASRHPLADQREIPVVHVTAFNELFWDTGRARTFVVEHGLPDPGHSYTGELRRCAVVINEPARRGRVTGTDLLARFGRSAPVDVFGMGGDALAAEVPPHTGVTAAGNLDPVSLRRAVSRRRVYLHPYRWTSLGLSLIDAMLLGMPVVAVAATEVVRAVPPNAGVVSTDVDELEQAVVRYLADPDIAREAGSQARRHALERYSHRAFLARWDVVLNQVGEHHAARSMAVPERRR